MRLFICLELVALAVFIFIAFHVVVYRNPYKLYMVFGKKGSGKTTLMTKLAIQYQKISGRDIPIRTATGTIINGSDG